MTNERPNEQLELTVQNMERDSTKTHLEFLLDLLSVLDLLHAQQLSRIDLVVFLILRVGRGVELAVADHDAVQVTLHNTSETKAEDVVTGNKTEIN